MFGYENELVYPIFVSKQTFEDSIDLLPLIKNDKSHYVYIKNFNEKIKTKNKNKKWFCRSCLQCFSSKNVLIKDEEDCLSINGMQSVDVYRGKNAAYEFIKAILEEYKYCKNISTKI